MVPARMSVQSCSEYDVLKQVILCSPQYLRIEKVINRHQKRYAEENIDARLAVKQHSALIETLRKCETEVFLLNAGEEYPEQVYTRDIGFVIGRRFFISNMSEDIRRGETDVLRFWLKKRNIPVFELKSRIEGGDVIVDGKTVWLGMSGRTSGSAAWELESKAPDLSVRPVCFNSKEHLHLDCVFNVISWRDALVYPPALAGEDYKKLALSYNLIEVEEDEQFTLGTNVLPIGKKRLVSFSGNTKTNEKLRRHGFSVVETDISEILKSGGSVRCVTLPLLRVPDKQI